MTTAIQNTNPNKGSCTWLVPPVIGGLLVSVVFPLARAVGVVFPLPKAVGVMVNVVFLLVIAVGGAVEGRASHVFVSQQTELQELTLYLPDCAATCLACEQTYCSVREQSTTEGLEEFT